MKCRPVRHGPCGAHHNRGLRQGRSRHEQSQRARALCLSRVHARIQDANGVSVEEGGREREKQALLFAKLIDSLLTPRPYFTAYRHQKEEPPTSISSKDPDSNFRNISGEGPSRQCYYVGKLKKRHAYPCC